MSTPPYTARNVMGLIGKLIEAKIDLYRMYERNGSFASMNAAENEVTKAENQLTEALEEVLK